MNFRFRSFSEEETFHFGRALGTALLPGVTVLLFGELGTGKTALVRGVGDALGTTRVRSPSFTLVNEYLTSRFTLVHADLYRLEPEDVEGLGLDEDGGEPRALLIEWPDRWRSPPRDALKVFIEFIKIDMGIGRMFEAISEGVKAEATLQNWIAALKREGAVNEQRDG
ncbi:MAG: tRNA (adenosine(37)-N6)-threonylcarbamoyltransferase complex ATPase subunit type 1 TsaE [Synergistaceae bacterium]|jgi:tRNA threonylcarbamoyladenosine biosynthesis protein TsaE|nr:tRNA (adenosine(37)-N6)-threonylcarbamoyltransferase complex ATPase subunit type 1 TsaE [Synergistaceae bacterium]